MSFLFESNFLSGFSTGEHTITDYDDEEPLAQWEAAFLPDWEWEAYEKEDDGLYFGRVKSPNTYGRWEYGYFSQEQLEKAGAYRTDLDPEEDAIAFGTYFGIKDLESEANPEPDYINSDEEKTESLRANLKEVAPYLLCRLEAERPSQDLIDQDTNGMDSFIKTLEIVEKIKVKYRFQYGEEEKVIAHKPDYFLSQEGREKSERPLPFVKSAEGTTEQNRYLARAICEYLQVSQLEGVLTLLNADSNDERRRYLKLAGAPSTKEDIESKKDDMKHGTSRSESKIEFDFEETEREVKGMESESDESGSTDVEEELEKRKTTEKRDYPVYEPGELELEGNTITIKTEPDNGEEDGSGSDGVGSGSGSTGGMSTVSASYRSRIDELGMWVTLQYERDRLDEKYECSNPESYIFDIHDEELYRAAKDDSIAGPVLENLKEKGLPELFPGFDILVVNPEDGEADRLIELKSSGHDTRTPPVTWNEWKTASEQGIQELFYLYIVGNLRKDIEAEPYLREIPNPFKFLNAETKERREVKKEVKVDVTSFKKEAEIKETSIAVDGEKAELD